MMFKLVVLLTLLMFLPNNTSGGVPCQELKLSGGIVCVCNSTYCDSVDPIEKLPQGHYVCYTSNKAGLRFNKTEGIFHQNGSLANSTSVYMEINTAIQYQQIFGFGTAFTDSAGINMLTLSNKAQENLLRSYFSPEGIEVNFGRVPMGGSDFSLRPYTLDDGVEDDELKNFNLSDEDFKYKIPFIRKAKSMSKKELHLLGTPWTAPPWMKTNNAYTGFGFLKKQYYDAWAKYYLKFLEAYDGVGLKFWGVTTGNEPLNGFIPFFIKFNSMGWYPKEQSQWIGNNLGPTIRSSKYNATNILALDDQRLLAGDWIHTLMTNEKAAEYINGFGIHWYWDFAIPVSVIDVIHSKYPNKFVMNTEASQGDKPWEEKVVPGSWTRGEKYMDDIIDDLNNWMSGWIEWNFALDMKGSPNWAHNFVDCPILVNKKKDEFYKQPMFYAIGHFSKFIQEGARRIDIKPTSQKQIKSLAVMNPNKSVVLILHNRARTALKVIFTDPVLGMEVITLEPFSFNTIIYWTK